MVQKVMAAALVGAMGFVMVQAQTPASQPAAPRRRRRLRVAAAGAARRRS